MSDEVPDGAAVFPEIPANLGVHPVLAALLHAVVFLGGSDDAIVEPEAADEALEYMASYLQRLDGADLERTQDDLAKIVRYAKQVGWPPEVSQLLDTFLADFGVGSDESE